jgi:L-seryl-tRNA(Ser) seleniumtransferase
MSAPANAAPKSPLAALPSVERLLRLVPLPALAARHGNGLVLEAARAELQALRAAAGEVPRAEAIADRVAARLAGMLRPSLRAVINLTGTVLHTNLGRAPLPEVAIEAMAAAARGNVNLEYELESGRRGDRDSHLEAWLCRLTGAEAATVVNNNAAAVLLLLNTLANRRKVAVSRGELIEIGGAFRLPDIMARAGCRLLEVGTTNRTHLKDFEQAVADGAALLMKVHTSNYVVQGFTASVPEAELAALAHRHGLPFVIDLGSGTLVDLRRWGLPHEPTVAETLASGADLVSFSGDKLLGGPQAGIVVGRRELIARLKRNPLKRATRVDKLTIAALGAILPLYADPERLPETVPTLRHLARPEPDIRATAERLAPEVARRLAGSAVVTVVPCVSEIGSGALPTEALASAALALRPTGRQSLNRLSQALRRLQPPILGRQHDGALLLDLRCLDDEATFLAAVDGLRRT